MDSKIIYDRKDLEYNEAVEKVILKIRSLPKSSMQSGDDSPYEDVWEEYAVQAQGEESFAFGLYEEFVENACYKLVCALTKSNLRRLWKKSDAFFEWDDEEPEPDTVEMEEDVSKELLRRVNGAASDYKFPQSDGEEC